MNNNLYIGVDPDIRNLNIAVLHGNIVEAIFLRRNKGGMGDTAVAQAAKGIKGVFDDFIKWITTKENFQALPIILIVESQNMQHARHQREKAGRNVDYQDLITTGQIAGIWMGAFAEIADRITLVQANTWTGQVPKEDRRKKQKNIRHPRAYLKVIWPEGIVIQQNDLNTPYLVNAQDSVSRYSTVQPNPGDFFDINDSIGLALYGAENNL